MSAFSAVTGEKKIRTDDSLNANDMNNTSIADYVWLPLRFDGDKVYIDWLDEWRIEDYE